MGGLGGGRGEMDLGIELMDKREERSEEDDGTGFVG